MLCVFKLNTDNFVLLYKNKNLLCCQWPKSRIFFFFTTTLIIDVFLYEWIVQLCDVILDIISSDLKSTVENNFLTQTFLSSVLFFWTKLNVLQIHLESTKKLNETNVYNTMYTRWYFLMTNSKPLTVQRSATDVFDVYQRFNFRKVDIWYHRCANTQGYTGRNYLFCICQRKDGLLTTEG